MLGESAATLSASERHLLSIDLDDPAIANADLFDDPLPPGYTSEIERELAGTLDLLDQCNVRATFFVNGQYCERQPDIPKEIARRGHHLASHGHRHGNVGRLTLEAFERDLCRSLEWLAPVQSDILGYRPPAFSMPYDEAHLTILARHGMRYVSSGVGVARSNAPLDNLPVAVAAGLLHVPISTVHLLRGRIKYPIGYGVTARLMPERLYLWTLRRWLKRHSYLHFYFHPFEAAGLAAGFKVPHRRLPAIMTTGIYSLRCRGRAEFLKKVLTSARFGSIEERLFGADGHSQPPRAGQKGTVTP